MKRLVLVGLAAALAIVPAGVAVADPGDGLGLRDVAAGLPEVPDVTGKRGQHLVCWAPEFTDWVVCVNYP